MEMLNSIVHSWDACNPDGVLLPTARLGNIFQLVSKQLQDPAWPAAARADAAELLSVKGSGLPPLLMLLRISGSTTSGEVIHFFRFWQAFEEVSRRLHGAGPHDAAEGIIQMLEVPLAEEIAEFRDGLLRKVDSRSVTQAMDGFVSQEAIMEDIARMKSMSADPASWTLLEARLGAGRSQATQQLQLHAVFSAILCWLRTICREYMCGERAAKIRSVRDVAGCEWRDACLYLTTSNWDEEAALQAFFAAQAPAGSIAPTGTSWSSGGAKLKKEETECPICMLAYVAEDGTATTGVPIQLGCCFKVLCRSCHAKLVNEENMISCPFCRVVHHVPTEAPRPEQGARRRSSSLNRICNTAELIANGASRAFDNVREASRRRHSRRASEGRDHTPNRRTEYFRSLPRAPLIPAMVLA